MRVLLDTCILSELKCPIPNSIVIQSIQEIDKNNLFISTLSIGEITKGVALLEDGKRKHDLNSWILGLEQYYADHIIPIDLETARIWGEVTAKAQKLGKAISAIDGLIASTALRHGLHLMTRNTSHFEPTGVLLINPFQ